MGLRAVLVLEAPNTLRFLFRYHHSAVIGSTFALGERFGTLLHPQTTSEMAVVQKVAIDFESFFSLGVRKRMATCLNLGPDAQTAVRS